MNKTQLRKNFETGNFQIGASGLKQFLWYYTDIFLFRSRLIPFGSVLVAVLRIFGAKVGREVRIKPGIAIKYPWKLEVGDHCWLAECIIDNLDWVRMGANCCVSQQAMLITGNHNYKKSTFDLITRPIVLEDGVWIGARATVGPGVIAGSHAILTLGSTISHSMESYSIYKGSPAIRISDRELA
ncbi:colanic acid biosynthesis acetyltransferase WcaF [Pedobacter frigidisoli]|uniref:Colanic acid biosynthesis acetyltransferase WcaF n=1 Tax=Pedobacter frigidisoli TaxID=2530455 RepID=A0A4R0NZ29_9SPHI|nr:WcaF family extracellular polysaccharide biosynthesis acetyltransferase [Pedobacter frigidisoli]TCD07710.1 colanic acid biosynthesis acetyltransferase WcaF [Pedobacter frigidisoli]